MVTKEWMSWLKDRHYDRAPIKEAIIDIQIESPNSLALTDLEKLIDSIPKGYTQRQNVMIGHLRGELEAGVLTASTDQRRVGFAFVGGDGKHVVQLRLNGFTFSRLAPYQTWTQLRDEARGLWQLYRTAVGELPVSRVALRYVNQLDIPLPMRDLRDFVRTYPEVSSDLSPFLSGFFLQVQIPQDDLGATLILNEALLPPPRPEATSVLLDIDLFRQELRLNADTDVWDILEELRIRKNLIFEGCITNSMRELIS